MRQLIGTILLVAVTLASARAPAVDSLTPAVSARRQIHDCMSRQMSVSKTISYNEAMKACKDQLRSTAALSNASASSKAVIAP